MKTMEKIQEVQNLEGKKVFLRADFNVSFEAGCIKDRFKIEASARTIHYLLEQKARVGIFSHLGRPQGKKDPEFSLSNIKSDLEEILKVRLNFFEDCIGDGVMENLEKLREGEALLLENVRFYPGEEYNDPQLAEKLVQGFDLYVNEAFGVSHREQASVTGAAQLLPNAAGFNLQKELEILEGIKDGFARPAVAIIGGAKIETKLPVIQLFEEKYDWVLVGGMVANEALDSGQDFRQNVILPLDFASDRLDIGEETRKRFKEIIASARTIIWNGPLGKFEEKEYALGTEDIYQAIIGNEEAFKVAGGGETLELLEKDRSFDKFDFVSTGGGAMLDYLSQGSLPGIEVLKK